MLHTENSFMFLYVAFLFCVSIQLYKNKKRRYDEFKKKNSVSVK